LITLINETIFFCAHSSVCKRIGLLSTFYETRSQPTENQTTKRTNANLLLTTRVKRKEKTNTALSHLHTYTHTFSHSLLLYISLSQLPIFLLVCPVYFKSRFTFLLYLVHFLCGLFMPFDSIFYFGLIHHWCL